VYAPDAVMRFFGPTWKDAACALGLRLRGRVPSRRRILRDYRAACMREGARPITSSMFRPYVAYGLAVVRKHFGSWHALVRAAGFDPADLPKHPSAAPVPRTSLLWPKVEEI